MDSHNNNASVSPSRTPGSYPESQPPLVERAPSVISTSVAVRDDIKNLISTHQFENCAWKGNPAWVIPKTKWAEIQTQLDQVIGEGKTTVGAAELAELQRELSLLRLKVNAFESEKERYEFASSNLMKALNTAKANEAKARSEADAALKELGTANAGLKSSLQAAQALKADFEMALQKAKREGTAEDVSKLREDKKRLSEEITTLNNSLQQVNSDRKEVESKLKRFERQSLELTNELNLEKSRYTISKPQPGQTFADKAAAMGTASVNLANAAYSNLSALARDRFSHVESDPTKDEKDTVFWLKATFDATKHAVYRPYKTIFDGLGGDIRSMSVRSRKLFDPFLIAVRDSLLPTGRPLTLDEMTSMISGIELKDIELNKAYRDKGYRTAQDLDDVGLAIGSPDAAGIPPRTKSFGKKRRNSDPAVKITGEKLVLRHPDLRPSDDEDGPSPGSSKHSKKGNQENSYYQKVRDWFHLNFDKMNSRVRRALKKSPARMKRYYSLAYGGFFKRFLLVPYSWYLWAFP